jgi:hypothetical protein
LIVTQTFALLFTAWIVLAAARATIVPCWLTALLIATALVSRFHLAYQFTHDAGLVMFAFDLVLIGAIWRGFFDSRRRALAWGVAGGFAALASPIVGLCWGAMTLMEARRVRALKPALLALAAAMAVLSPWIVRNAVVFHRFIPVKSNLAYELYQGQAHNEDGRLTTKVFGSHPYASAGAERFEYVEKGEMAFLDAKRTAFWSSLRENPRLFAWKVWDRTLAVGLDYSPMEPQEYERRTLFEFCYLTHPVWLFASLSLLILLTVLTPARGAATGIALMACYLAPYVVISYYDRYELPVWGLKVLLLVWCLDAVGRGILGFFPNRRGVSRRADTTLRETA